MRLHEFMRANIEAILTIWEHEFNHGASTGSTMDFGPRRALTRKILLEIASELETGSAATFGTLLQPPHDEARSASNHGDQRLAIGYTLQQLQSEYRILRHVVVSEWIKVRRSWLIQEIMDMATFNAALDRALGASTSAYVAGLDRSRDLFVGVLGHDLRGPINAALMSIFLLGRDPNLNEQSRAALSRSERSVMQMNDLVSELLDFVSAHFGLHRQISFAEVSMTKICEEAIGDAQTIYPTRKFVATFAEDTAGRWDAHRVRQAVYNLLRNANEHGDAAAPVTITTHSDKDSVTVEVHNQGNPIPPLSLARVFDPFIQASSGEINMQPQGSIGLGLFIVRDVATMHDGRVSVDSTVKNGTVFSIKLPRNPKGPVPVA